MSPIIRFAHDDSLWRFVTTMECVEWEDISTQSPYERHHYGLINGQDHWYIYKDATLEIDAVSGTEISMSGSRQDTMTTVVYLDSALVGLTRATTGRFGDAMSGFTYVKIGSVLLGISAPGFDDVQWEPVVEVWTPPLPRSLQDLQFQGISGGFYWYDGDAFEEFSRSHSITVESKIPGEDSAWLEKMQTVSKFGDTEHETLLACDGELPAAPWHGNPRDIRRQILGLPVDPKGWCPDPNPLFGKDT